MNVQATHFAPIGAGPGTQTPDGCSVELYKRTPYRGEIESISEQLQGKSVLELGCGTGRLTTRLLEMGCRVLGIDNSPDMLALLPESVDRALSDIETLSLDQYFDVVLLASYVFNQPDDRVRHGFATAARRHLQKQGSFVLQVHSESLLRAGEGHTAEADGIVTRIQKFRKHGNLVSMSVQYSVDEMEWTHTFQAQVLEFDQVVLELMNAGFSEVDWIDKPLGWLCAI